MVISNQVFAIFFAVFFGAILRVAQDWFPFTPAGVSDPHCRRDIYRILMSLLFLVLLPAMYFTWVMVKLSTEPPPIILPHSLLSKEAIKFLLLLLLILPPLGLYDLWQFFVRWKPSTFYPDSTRQRVQQRVPNAFTESKSAIIAGIPCLLPAIVFLLL